MAENILEMIAAKRRIFKFTFEKYGDMQAAAEIANKVFYCNAAPLLAAYIQCDVLLEDYWKNTTPVEH